MFRNIMGDLDIKSLNGVDTAPCAPFYLFWGKPARCPTFPLKYRSHETFFAALALTLAAGVGLLNCWGGTFATATSGSTCFSIAQAAGLTTDQLLSFNPGLDCSALAIGEQDDENSTQSEALPQCRKSSRSLASESAEPDGSCATGGGALRNVNQNMFNQPRREYSIEHLESAD
ncbi:hypothetical protein B0H19DRAFT_1060028 [Mycena capillaripes]|nr:hypothetical protein B0H19DRAFT_1060028 [Mycena capillaripes]